MYNRRHHLGVSHGIVNAIKKERPDEDVHVDEENARIVWGKKPDGQESSIDKYRKNYPWI